jgi:tRNA pseudouridine38/39 synthase
LAADYNYKKCGRTDKGVSAAGNVINLLVRDDKSDPSTYTNRLNAVLPNDIRVLDCKKVSESFNSRINCDYREYRYFFFKKNYNVDQMLEGARKLLGEHDFRNFCKLNLIATTNHVRTILDVDVQKADFQYIQESNRIPGMNDYFQLWYVKIRGTAFLWHMIRYIMSVLFEIGEGQAEPEVVSQLLDVQKTPNR